MAIDPGKPWRLEVEFNNSRSYSLNFEEHSGAEAQIKQWLDKGYVTEDRAADGTKYDTSYHPIGSVRRFNVFDKGSE